MTIVKTLRRIAWLIAAATLAVGMLAGCGGSGGGSTSGDDGDGGSKAAGRQQSETLVLALSRQLKGIDPHGVGAQSPDGDASVTLSVYDGLTRFSPTGKVEPSLATSWKEVDDRTWVFTLRDGVRFSDGTPLTPEVVAWNFEEFLGRDSDSSSGSGVRSYLRSAEATGENQVTFHLRERALNLPQRIWDVGITTREYWESGDLSTGALGTGPYVVESIDLENGAKLKANPGYWGAKPAFADVEYKVLASEAQRVAALKAGEIDLALNLDPSSLRQFEGDDRFEVTLEGSPWVQTLATNELKRDSPLRDVKVRQALNYAIDKQGIVDSVFEGKVDPLPGTILSKPLYETDAYTPYAHDPAKARQLLREAGYGDGIELELAISQGTYAGSDAIAQALQAQLAEAGVELTITQEQFPAWIERQYGDPDDAADLVYVGWYGYYENDWTQLTWYQSKSVYQQSNFEDPRYDELVHATVSADDEQSQLEHATEAARYFGEQAHSVFLWSGTLSEVAKRNITWEPRGWRYLFAQEVGVR